jgi:hypothetical protein
MLFPIGFFHFPGRRMNGQLGMRSSLPSKRSGFKDLLLGKGSIPRSDKEIHEKTEGGNVLMNNTDLNEMVYSELIL